MNSLLFRTISQAPGNESMIRGCIMPPKTNKEQIKNAIREYLEMPEGPEIISNLLHERELNGVNIPSRQFHDDLPRTQKNTPVAGYRISSENMHRMHEKLMSVVPYEAFIAPFLEDGGIIEEGA